MSQAAPDEFSAPTWPAADSPNEWGPRCRPPKVNIAERDDEVIVTAEVPGLQTSDLDVSVTNDVLTVRAHQSHEHEEVSEEGSFHRHEILQGSFVRHIRLPCAVDAEGASASYQDGMLKVFFPNALRGGTAATNPQERDSVLTVYFGVAGKHGDHFR